MLSRLYNYMMQAIQKFIRCVLWRVCNACITCAGWFRSSLTQWTRIGRTYGWPSVWWCRRAGSSPPPCRCPPHLYLKNIFFSEIFIWKTPLWTCVLFTHNINDGFFFVCLMTIKNDEYRTFFVEKKVFNAKYDDFCCVDSQPRTYHYFFYILAFYPTIWLFTENLIKYRFYYMIGFWHISYQQCRLRTIKDSCCVIYASLSFFPCLSVFLSVCLSVRNFFLLFVWLFFSLFPYLLRSYR